MQLGLVQFLLGSVPGGTSAGEGEGTGDLFSQLLGDMGADGGQQQGQSALLAGDVSPAALLAQELDPASLAALNRSDTEALTKLLEQPITPEMASDLLDKMESQGFEQGQNEAFDQLHNALEQIEAAGEPMDVATLLETLPVVEQAANPAERAPLMQRMLSFLHGALEKKKEAPQDLAAAGALPDATTQSLQAGLFRAATEDTQGAPQAVTNENAASATDTEATDSIVPAMLTMPPAAAAIPAWVRKISDESTPIAEIDAAIPPLASAGDAGGLDNSALPDVDLPDAPMPAQAEVPATAAHASAKENRIAFDEALALQAGNTGHDIAEDTVVTQVDSAGAVQASAGMAPSSHSSMTVQTHSAIAHTHTHIAAAEQVQVAITTATKDGLDRITMQLEPADLGRVEVRMEMGLDGRTQLHFTVDKAETLDALARDARSLERSLQEAGIKADAGSMQFNLRQQPQFAAEMGGEGKGGRQQHAANDNEESIATTAVSGITKHYTINVREGVDIHA